METNSRPLTIAVAVGSGGMLVITIPFSFAVGFELMEPLVVTSAAISFIALLVFLVRRAVKSKSANDKKQ
jgi:hypothetical protein